MPSLGGGGKYGGSDVGRGVSTDREGRGDSSRGERNKQRMASALSGGAATLAGAHPITAAIAQGAGGFAAGMEPGRAIGRGIGTGAGWMFGGPLGGWLGGKAGEWLGGQAGGNNNPDYVGGFAPQHQRPKMMARREDRDGGNNPLLWPPGQGGQGRQGMIGALI